MAGALLLLALLPGCATYQAYQARFREPDYTVTPEFFTRSPRRVAIFPFATRSLKEQSLERAQVCRIAFYQHFSVRDFEDVDMQLLDRQLLPTETARPRRHLQQFANTIRALDIVGLTSFLDWKSLLGREDRDTTTFRSWIRTAYEDLQADAYVLGITRGYGRIYAVAFSSVGLATHVEMRATSDDALLWSADFRARNMKLPLTIDPLDVPFLLYDIWKNSYGGAMDVLAFQVYRDVVQTMPPLRAQGTVHVRATRPKTRVFKQPTVWAFWPRPQVRKGTRLKFLLERRGWYQCEGKDGQPVWILCRDGALVDENGKLLEKTDPMSYLWE
ncbi:MAG TPA: hypothetical protein DCM68_03980 [Verrucomicrobia bacterium]|nr:hypothetical protein [Verrucomicrobiota bacterium]